MTQIILFGTDGIRKTMGREPLQPLNLVQLGNALGYWITKMCGVSRVIIAHDTRLSCSLVKSCLKGGLLQHELIITDSCVVATPVLFNIVAHGPFDIGIMITASHNAYEDNGIKIFTKKTGKITTSDEQEISQLYATVSETNSYEFLGTDYVDISPIQLYTQAIQQKFSSHFLDNLVIVLDCANGAFSFLAPALFQSFGAKVITLSNSPTGKNINQHCGSQHPQSLQEAVIQHNAHIGFAFDGDGDRVTVVNKYGQIKDGDELLAFLLNHPSYKNEATLVGTLMTNQGLEKHLKNNQKTLIRTPVGDKYVIKKMQELECLVGGEPSGHIILRDFTNISDGLFVALRIAETALMVKNWNLETFIKFPQIIINVPTPVRKDLSCTPYAQLIQKYQQQLLNGRLLVRYSGTESLLRVMVEDTSKEHAQAIGTLLSQELIKQLKKENYDR